MNDKLAGRLVVAAEVERRFATMVVEARNALLRVPSRIKGRTPDVTRALLELIDEEIRAALEGLADRRGGVTPKEDHDAERNGNARSLHPGRPRDSEPLAGQVSAPAR